MFVIHFLFHDGLNGFAVPMRFAPGHDRQHTERVELPISKRLRPRTPKLFFGNLFAELAWVVIGDANSVRSD